jgi:hypothetical protein
MAKAPDAVNASEDEFSIAQIVLAARPLSRVRPVLGARAALPITPRRRPAHGDGSEASGKKRLQTSVNCIVVR